MRFPHRAHVIRDHRHQLCWFRAPRSGRRCLRPASEHRNAGHPYVMPPPEPLPVDRAARRIARAVTRHMRLDWEVPL